MGPIGLFDSGVGGLSVLRQLQKLRPQEDYVYFADTLHMPYGLRSKAELESIVFSICDFLLREQCRAIVMACNTASALVLPLAQQRYEVPLFGVILPGARAAAQATLNGRIGVLATEATVRSQAYTDALRAISPGVEVLGQACTPLAPLIEQGKLEGADVNEALLQCLGPVLRWGVDTLVLGCTHYPFLRPLLSRLVPASVIVVDPAEQTAQEVQEHVLPSVSGRGTIEFYVSGGAAQFAKVAQKLGGGAIEPRQVKFSTQANELTAVVE